MTTARHVSPLGRYDRGGSAGPLRQVRLLRLPVRIFAAGRQHHEELLRELALLALAGDTGGDRSGRVGRLARRLGEPVAGAAEREDADIDAALARGEDTVDLTYHVPAEAVAAATELSRLLGDADELSRREELLTLARSPTDLRFATWYTEEFRRQIAGEPPVPWDGPLDP